MVRIRLRRVGSAHQPSFRIVVADAESPRDGRFIEIIGSYNPRTDPPAVELKDDRAVYWLGVGAQPSDAVDRLLRKRGIYDRLEQQRAAAKQPAGFMPETTTPAASLTVPELPEPETPPALPSPEA